MTGYALDNYYPRISRIRDHRQGFEGSVRAAVCLLWIAPDQPDAGGAGGPGGDLLPHLRCIGDQRRRDHAAGAARPGDNGADAVLLVPCPVGMELGLH